MPQCCGCAVLTAHNSMSGHDGEHYIRFCALHGAAQKMRNILKDLVTDSSKIGLFQAPIYFVLEEIERSERERKEPTHAT